MMVRFWVMRLVRLLYCPAAVQSRITSSICADPWETSRGAWSAPRLETAFRSKRACATLASAPVPCRALRLGKAPPVCAPAFFLNVRCVSVLLLLIGARASQKDVFQQRYALPSRFGTSRGTRGDISLQNRVPDAFRLE